MKIKPQNIQYNLIPQKGIVKLSDNVNIYLASSKENIEKN